MTLHTHPPRLHCPLPQVGFNKWESIEVLPMQRSEELAGNGAGGDWWQVRREASSATFSVQRGGKPAGDGSAVCCGASVSCQLADTRNLQCPPVTQVDLALPELLSRIDFVTMDTNSGAVDNNG